MKSFSSTMYKRTRTAKGRRGLGGTEGTLAGFSLHAFVFLRDIEPQSRTAPAAQWPPRTPGEGPPANRGAQNRLLRGLAQDLELPLWGSSPASQWEQSAEQPKAAELWKAHGRSLVYRLINPVRTSPLQCILQQLQPRPKRASSSRFFFLLLLQLGRPHLTNSTLQPSSAPRTCSPITLLQVVEICRWPALAASTTSSLSRAFPTSSRFEYDSMQCYDGAAQTQQLLLLVEARYYTSFCRER